MNLAKTIQLDVSDTRIFEHAANPAEWAISGTFAFIDDDPLNWSRKKRFAFQSSWLGLKSYGNSTFVQVTKISGEEYEFITRSLTEHFIKYYNAPNPEEAGMAATQEIEDMVSVCNHPAGTLLKIERSIFDDKIKESTKVIIPNDSVLRTQAWEISEEK